MGRGRRIRDAAEAGACLDAVAASGLTRTQWAHQNGIDGRSMQGWWMVLESKRRKRPPAELRLVELVPPESVGIVTYTVRYGALSVEVDDRFDAQVLRRLLSVVVSC
jgi:hypothetical protein